MQEIGSKPKSKSLWHHPDFMKLWVSDTIAQFGGQFSGNALPLIAAVLFNANAAEFGIITFATFLPWLLFALPVGAWVDRRRRRPVLVFANIGRAFILLLIPVAWFFRESRFTVSLGNSSVVITPFSLYLVYLVTFLVGLLTVFFDISYQAYFPSLVDREQLVEGNSKLETSRATSQVAGPTIAGTVIQLISVARAPLAILADAVGFLFASFFLGRIKQREDVERRLDRPSMISQIREGLRVVFGNKMLRSIAGCTSTSNFFSTALFTLFILFCLQELNIGQDVIAFVLGIVGSVGSIGGLVGALFAGKLAKRWGVGPMIVVSVFIAGVGGLAVAFATPSLAIPLLIVGQGLGGWGSVVYNINQVSLRQAIVPQQLQGRMNATMRFLVWGTMPVGGLAGGILGTVLGLRLAVTITALGGLLSGLWVLFSPVRGLQEIPMQVTEVAPTLTA